MLESFVLQQLVAQATWTDADLRFWHYRDKDQVEVDVVISRGRQVWGVEVKAGATVTSEDGRGLRRLAERAGRSFQAESSAGNDTEGLRYATIQTPEKYFLTWCTCATGTTNDRFLRDMDRVMPDWRSRRRELNEASLGHEEWSL